MLKVGITGGIGAGKSVVCQVFKTLGIPVFDADATAKYLMEHDQELVSGIKELFGEQAYIDSSLNRQYISTQVFQDKSLLEQLNGLVHPKTIAYGNKWMISQKSPYVIKEAAIFFESGSYKEMDIMIGVSAPESLRIKRVLNSRDITLEKVQQRIANQMDDNKKMKMCDYVIINDDNTSLITQVVDIHQKLLNRD